ncbi:hypothetical protein Ancab_029922 [Ancistrocladus abbreviatus]
MAACQPLALHHQQLSFSPYSLPSSMPTTLSLTFSAFRPFSLRLDNTVSLLRPHASISRNNAGAYDPELRLVLELATNSELHELERILFGPSYFSPLLKSVTGRAQFDHVMIEEDLQERENYIEALESRFLYLAADARSTLRGWRPSYRDVLLSVRKELNIHCSSKLCTEDLEAEIFMHLLQDYSSQLKGQNAAALKVGVTELQSVLFKGGQVLTLLKFSQSLLRRLSGKVLLETANCQIENEAIRKGGQLAAINLERQVALLAARKGFAGAASRYLGFRSMVSFIGPLMWGTFLADVVITMLGTDYARVLQAIYAFAQIRIIRTYKAQVDEHGNRV